MAKFALQTAMVKNTAVMEVVLIFIQIPIIVGPVTILIMIIFVLHKLIGIQETQPIHVVVAPALIVHQI